MKYCTKCGKELTEEAVICLNCGCFVNEKKAEPKKEEDSKSFAWSILGFFFPILGLILWLIWKDDMPLRAHSVGIGALIGAIATVVVYIIYFFIFVVLWGIGFAALIGY